MIYDGTAAADAVIHGLDLVFALDGRPVEDVVRAVAARTGRDEQTLRALALANLPELVRKGFVRAARAAPAMSA